MLPEVEVIEDGSPPADSDEMKVIDEMLPAVDNASDKATSGLEDSSNDDLYYHLNHTHGAPARDLYAYGPMSTYTTGYAGAFDEKREEGSIYFQMWQYYRKVYVSRAPMTKPIENIDSRNIMQTMVPRMKYKKSTYVPRSSPMRDIQVDFSMIFLSTRLFPAVNQAIDIMSTFNMKHNLGWDCKQYMTFYECGSFKINCCSPNDATQEAPKPICVSYNNVWQPGKECTHQVWVAKAKELHQSAKERSKDKYGLHC